jgi:beta-glucanase (GH16 family)
MRLPRGQGVWPAFWLLGDDISGVGWPECGEIDIMENIGKEPALIHGSLHGPGYSGANPLGAPYNLPNNQPFAEAFHVYAVEWEKDVVRFYVDDALYQTLTPKDLPNNAKWVYDHAFFLLLNVAVGGQWPGSPDDSTTFPQTLTVDYVRVYER